MEDFHCAPEAIATGGLAPPRQRNAQRQVVRVAIGWGRLVLNSVGEAVVVGFGVSFAAGAVEGGVRDEAVVGGENEGLFAAVVGAAVGVLAELGGDGGEEGGAGGRVADGAGGVEGAGDVGEGFGAGEEGHGVLRGSFNQNALSTRVERVGLT